MTELQETSWLIPLIFIGTYTALAFGQIPGLRIDRVGIVLVGMAAMLVADYQSADEALRSTNWNTLALLFSLMMISGQLTQGDLINRMAHQLLEHRWQPSLLLLAVMSMIAGFAAFITNEVAVLLFTPLVIQQLQPLGYRPISSWCSKRRLMASTYRCKIMPRLVFLQLFYRLES